MNTVNCRIKQNEYQEIGRRDVTPAEALVIRAIHDRAAHRFAGQATTPEELARFWKVLVEPTAAGVAMTIEYDGDGNKTGQHKRTNGEELARLRGLYPALSRDNPKMHIIDELFPGLNPVLPETFDDIGLEVAPPSEPKAQSPKAKVQTAMAVKDAEPAEPPPTVEKLTKGAKKGKAAAAPKTE